jgi:hypothetical protein
MQIIAFNIRNRAALLWLTAGLGGQIYAMIESLTYLSAWVTSHGKPPEVTFDSGALWVVGIMYSLWILPPLLCVVAWGPAADWTILLVGGFWVIGGTIGGIFDGIRDGGHVAATALIAIGLPGLFALRASWRMLRGHADEGFQAQGS